MIDHLNSFYSDNLKNLQILKILGYFCQIIYRKTSVAFWEYSTHPATLFIAGGGTLKKKDFPQDKNILLLGKLPFEDTIKLLNESDIFVLPTSCPEGFPTSSLEAGACQNFVITTDRGGNKEIISDEKYGIVLDNNSPEEIAKALFAVASDEIYRKETGKRLREKIERSFTFERLYETISLLPWEKQEEKTE